MWFSNNAPAHSHSTRLPLQGRKPASLLLATVPAALSVALTLAGQALAEGKSQTGMLDPLMEDSSLNLELRNFYFNRDYREHRMSGTDARPSVVESWAQAARLKLESGYIADLIGLDATWYGSLKLIGDEEKYGSGALRADNEKVKNNHLTAKQDTYDKLGEIYLKTRFGNEDRLNAHIKAGRMFIDTLLFNDSDVRATPSTSQAIWADINCGGLTIYGFSSDQASTKTESGFHKYKNSRGDDWRVNIGGAGYDFGNGIGVNAAIGRAQDYLKQDLLNAYYTLPLGSDTSLFFDGYYQKAKTDGRKNGSYDSNNNWVVDKWDSKLWNIAAQLNINNLGVMLSYQRVNGDYYNYSWDDFAHDDNGLYTWNAVQYLDFNKKDEKSWQGRIDYSFDDFGCPDMRIMARYIRGEFKDGSLNVNEWERDTDLKYSVSKGMLKGLSITWRNATVRSYDKGDSINANRLIIDYTVAIL